MRRFYIVSGCLLLALVIKAEELPKPDTVFSAIVNGGEIKVVKTLEPVERM